MPQYTLTVTVGSTIDLTLRRLAGDTDLTGSQILERAIVAYATISKYPAVYVELPANDGSTPPQSTTTRQRTPTNLRRIALP